MAYIVICIDDTGRYTQATRAVFDHLDEIERYCSIIDQGRHPMIVRASKEQTNALAKVRESAREFGL